MHRCSGAAFWPSIVLLFACAGCSSGVASAGSRAVRSGSGSPASGTVTCKALRGCVKGQRIDANAVQRSIRAAVLKAGGTYRVTMQASSITAFGKVRVSGDTTDAVVTQDLNGQKLRIIVLDGVGYVSGTGMGTTPFVEVTPGSKGAFAQGLKPLLNISLGRPLPDTVQWEVTATSPVGITLTATPAVGVTTVQTLDERNLPVRTVESSGSQTSTRSYSDYGQPVDITAPPSSDVVDVSTVTSP